MDVTERDMDHILISNIMKRRCQIPRGGKKYFRSKIENIKADKDQRTS